MEVALSRVLKKKSPLRLKKDKLEVGKVTHKRAAEPGLERTSL